MLTTFEGKFSLHYAQIVFRLECRINRVVVLKGFTDGEHERLGFCCLIWVRIKCPNDEVAVLTWWSQGGVPLCLFHFLSTKQSEDCFTITSDSYTKGKQKKGATLVVLNYNIEIGKKQYIDIKCYISLSWFWCEYSILVQLDFRAVLVIIQKEG